MRGLLLAGLPVTLAAWVALDLYVLKPRDLGAFDPETLARLEAELWRSYAERDRLGLVVGLGRLVAARHGIPPMRAGLAAFHLARASFLFKHAQGADAVERALPDLRRHYAVVRRGRRASFDPERAARLELGVWTADRGGRDPHDLEGALAALQAELYGVPAGQLAEYARLRHQAMTFRDERARAGAITAADRMRIEVMLAASWRILSVHAQRASAGAGRPPAGT